MLAFMDDLPLSKFCSSCQTTKPASEFYKSGTRPGKLVHRCKACSKRIAIEWQAANPDRVRASQEKYRDAHPRPKTPERLKAQNDRRKEYYDRNKDLVKRKALESKWKAKAADPIRFRATNAISNNRCRFKKLGLPSDFTIHDWDALMLEFGRRCAWCSGQASILDMDHIKPADLGGWDVVGNLVPTCRPCNAHKGRMSPEDYAQIMGVNLDRLRARALVRAPLAIPPSTAD